ncbi:MAG: CHAT domain-containing protein [Epsilonproteobacteria bacterium]|nr:CHAT domain-containing protein [Campylobacterota bacterium]
MKLKKQLNQLTNNEVLFLENLITVLKTSNNNSINIYTKNQKIKKLFANGDRLWREIYPNLEMEYFTKDNFYYDRLCSVVTGYYTSTNQDYLSIDIYKKLIDKANKGNISGVELSSMIKLAKIYMKLGQIELARITIENIKNIIDDYFELIYDDIEMNGSYGLLLNSAYRELVFELAMLDEDVQIDLKQEQKFFDFLIRAYNKAYFYLPFMKLEGVLGVSAVFAEYDKNSISHTFFYTNYELMYRYAKLFFINGDTKRGKIAFELMKEALLSNGNGTFQENIEKDAMSEKRTFQSQDEYGKKIPLIYSYLLSLYEADIQSIKNPKEAKETLQKAQNSFTRLKKLYKKLPPEYKYIDGVLQTYKDLLGTRAKIYEKNKLYKKASEIYDKLIVENEQIRESLPLEFRRGYFRGYAKDAYLGFIRVKTKLYNTNTNKESFEGLLSAINLLNSRQLKDLKPSYTKETNLYDIQSKLNKDEMVYIIFDVEKSILCASITKDKTFATLLKKEKNLNQNFYDIKQKLTKEQYYDRDKLLEISSGFTKPLENFKGIKYIHLLSEGISSILPFCIYPLDEKKMVFERYIVDYLTTLKVPQKIEFRENANLFAVGDAIYDKKEAQNTFLTSRSVNISGYFVRLPETREEIRSISTKFHHTKLLLGKDAKESIIKHTPLKKYSYIHFATHGILGGEIPNIDEAALVLTKEEGEDSLLVASEIAKLNLNASLVVLSACNTGNGKYFRGEGVSGISRAFKIAGSNKIVASLWSVDSLSTLKLMESFYNFLLDGKQPNEALYLAQKQLQNTKIYERDKTRGLRKKDMHKPQNTYVNPYFWSAFVVFD